MITRPVSEQIPIRSDAEGRLRVGKTRVLLDLIIYAYWRGATPETITESYPTLSLDEVYMAIGYYLRHRAEVDAYLEQQEAEAETGRRAHETALLARLDANRTSLPH